MEVRYYIDPATSLPHVYKHGVSESEVEEVLDRPDEDRRSRSDTRVALGRTNNGRAILIVYTPEEFGTFVITAYPLAGRDLSAFRRRLRRRWRRRR